MQKYFYLLFLLIGTTSIAQQATFKDAFLEKWNNSRDYLIAVAEAMPEEFYDYKPTAKQMSFQEQLIHIQGNIYWLDSTYFTPYEVQGEPEDIHAFNKEELKNLITRTFNDAYRSIESTTEEEFKKSVKFFAGPKSKLQIMNLMQDHVTHHRGQLLVYLNLKGIQPPGYSGW